jgi:hypothetical protein
MDQARTLRELASWYREFAERAGEPAIWHARILAAEDLEREAGDLESNRPISSRFNRLIGED